MKCSQNFGEEISWEAATQKDYETDQRTILSRILGGCEVDRTGSGSCPMVGCGTSGVGTSATDVGGLLLVIQHCQHHVGCYDKR